MKKSTQPKIKLVDSNSNKHYLEMKKISDDMGKCFIKQVKAKEFAAWIGTVTNDLFLYGTDKERIKDGFCFLSTAGWGLLPILIENRGNDFAEVGEELINLFDTLDHNCSQEALIEIGCSYLRSQSVGQFIGSLLIEHSNIYNSLLITLSMYQTYNYARNDYRAYIRESKKAA